MSRPAAFGFVVALGLFNGCDNDANTFRSDELATPPVASSCDFGTPVCPLPFEPQMETVSLHINGVEVQAAASYSGGDLPATVEHTFHYRYQQLDDTDAVVAQSVDDVTYAWSRSANVSDIVSDFDASCELLAPEQDDEGTWVRRQCTVSFDHLPWLALVGEPLDLHWQLNWAQGFEYWGVRETLSQGTVEDCWADAECHHPLDPAMGNLRIATREVVVGATEPVDASDYVTGSSGSTIPVSLGVSFNHTATYFETVGPHIVDMYPVDNPSSVRLAVYRQGTPVASGRFDTQDLSCESEIYMGSGEAATECAVEVDVPVAWLGNAGQLNDIYLMLDWDAFNDGADPLSAGHAQRVGTILHNGVPTATCDGIFDWPWCPQTPQGCNNGWCPCEAHDRWYPEDTWETQCSGPGEAPGCNNGWCECEAHDRWYPEDTFEEQCQAAPEPEGCNNGWCECEAHDRWYPEDTFEEQCQGPVDPPGCNNGWCLCESDGTWVPQAEFDTACG